MRLLAILLLAAGAARAQTTIAGDALVDQSMAISTTSSPNARMQVFAGSSTVNVLQVTSVDRSPGLTVRSSGKVGVGGVPVAALDVFSSGDSTSTAVVLRNGNIFPGTDAVQISFGQNGASNLRQAIRSFHSSTTANNGLDFILWTAAQSTTAVGSFVVAELVTSSVSASVHILPVGVPDSDLEVSNGVSEGGGTMHRWAEGSLSSRDLKADVRYFDEADERKAYADIQRLKPAEFRYKRIKRGRLVRDRHLPLVRGLIYEDAPESVRTLGNGIAIDYRVLNAELAAQELIRRLEALQEKLKPESPQ